MSVIAARKELAIKCKIVVLGGNVVVGKTMKAKNRPENITHKIKGLRTTQIALHKPPKPRPFHSLIKESGYSATVADSCSHQVVVQQFADWPRRIPGTGLRPMNEVNADSALHQIIRKGSKRKMRVEKLKKFGRINVSGGNAVCAAPKRSQRFPMVYARDVVNRKRHTVHDIQNT